MPTRSGRLVGPPSRRVTAASALGVQARRVERRASSPLPPRPLETAENSPRSESRAVPPPGARHGNQNLAPSVCVCVLEEERAGSWVRTAARAGLLSHCELTATPAPPSPTTSHLGFRCLWVKHKVALNSEMVQNCSVDRELSFQDHLQRRPCLSLHINKERI